MATEGHRPTPRETAMICETAASSAINRDPLALPFHLRLLEPTLVDLHKGMFSKRPETARLGIDRDLRRTLMRVLADRRGAALLPYTLDVLQPESTVVDRYMQDGWFEQFGDRPVFHGDRERVHYGDEAIVAATLMRFYTDANEEMYDDLRRRGEYDLFAQAYSRLTENVNNQARRVAQLEGGIDPASDPQRKDGTSAGARLLITLANYQDNGITPDMKKILEINSRGQAEFYAAALGDLYDAFNQAGCPEELRLETALKHVSVLSLLAALKDERSGEILFEGRDTREHKNIWKVLQNPGSQAWEITPTVSPLIEFARDMQDKSRHGRCPATGALELVSLDAERDYSGLVRSQTALSGRTGKDMLSSAEVIVVAALGVVDQLLKKGIITFNSRQ